jgi:hypothetical protein
MLPMMLRVPTSLRRRRLLGRSHEARCEDGDEHLPQFVSRRQRRRRIARRYRPRIGGLRAELETANSVTSVTAALTAGP